MLIFSNLCAAGFLLLAHANPAAAAAHADVTPVDGIPASGPWFQWLDGVTGIDLSAAAG